MGGYLELNTTADLHPFQPSRPQGRPCGVEAIGLRFRTGFDMLSARRRACG
jgi:hypothetical protein